MRSRSRLISSLVLAASIVLPAAGWAQQPPPTAPPARVAPAPATQGGNMDEVVRVIPSQLVCTDGRSLCEVTAANTQGLEALRSEVVELRTQVTAVVTRRLRRRTPSHPGRTSSRTPQPPTVLIRVRRLEASGAATAERLEAAARDIPTLTVLQAQCIARHNNPSFVLPPGTDCDAVARDLAAAQAAAARPAAPSAAAASLILR